MNSCCHEAACRSAISKEHFGEEVTVAEPREKEYEKLYKCGLYSKTMTHCSGITELSVLQSSVLYLRGSFIEIFVVKWVLI